MKQNKTPCDRGGADRYYGQPFNPHYVVDGVTVTDLTPEQIAEYWKGWFGVIESVPKGASRLAE